MHKKLKLFRLVWGDGEIIEQEATSLEEAVQICQKGMPRTWCTIDAKN